MDYWQHLNATRKHDLQGLSDGLALHFSELMQRGHSVADLLMHFGDDFGHLPAERLRELALAHRQWLLWRRRRRTLDSARAKAKLPPLPEEALAQAPEPHQLDAIVRTARLSPRKAVETQQTWIELLRAGVDLWTRAVAIARKQGQLRSRAKDLDDPRAGGVYDSYVNYSACLGELAPHRWLAMRRGQREGVLELSLELPHEELLQEVTRLRDQLGPGAKGRDDESLLSELVLDDLEPWLLRILDSSAQERATTEAAKALAGLLRSAPVQARKIGAVFMARSGGPIGLAVVNRDGDVLARKALRMQGNWLDRVCEFLQEASIQHVALPASTPQVGEQLASLEEKLGQLGLEPLKVRTAALAEARQPLMDPPLRLGSSVASATVLARRVLDPLKEWAGVDPVGIGIAEYQNDLDQEQLRAALTDTVELCRLERRRGKRGAALGSGVARGSAAMARLNPLVKGLADLRPGMTVHGVITNISHFGAFVNIGLPQEALVHISELSDQFVSNPNDVVSIGQQVTAHILAVDPGRGRISLSLKTQRPTMLEHDGGRRRDRGNARPNRTPPMSKAQALANLEKLFKK